jgi:hypothetical protein
MIQACETVLGEMGWETTSQMSLRFSDDAIGDTGMARRPKAFLAATQADEIQVSRLSGTPTIIFVLDTTPSSLIKTYRQIKNLVGQRQDLRRRCGLLFAPPIDGGRERLLSSCQQFLGLRPCDLGTIPSALVRGSRGDESLATQDAWRLFVGRCLSQL